ncbi:MAG TPA: YihY/virulence factor BrkB family protein [Actinomycetota bacterium]|nr:YihY/virulence factor BrkB family protein [Actinomycetota bacterium]
MTEAKESAAQRMLLRADEVQRRHTVLAFPVAVLKKFGDDRASHLAALISYYGFFSIFPLLLLFATVVAIVVRDDPELRQRLLDSAVSQFPIVGTRIGRTVGELTRSSFTLSVGIVGALWSGTAVVAAAQHAMDEVWDVPRVERPGPLTRVVRAALLLFVFGASIVLSTFLVGSGGEPGWSAALLDVLSLAGTVLASAAVFAFAFRVLTVAHVSWRDVLPGAIVAAIAWTILLMLGGWLVDQHIRRASQVYGFFAIVIGLLAWISLVAQVFLLAAEINVVRARRLWPRSLIAPLENKDREVLASQAEEERARPEERVDVKFDGGEGEGR